MPGLRLTEAEIRKLERRPTLTAEEHLACFSFYEERLTSEMDPRTEIDLSRAIGHHAKEAFEGGVRDEATLRRLLAGLEAAARVQTFSGPWRKVAAHVRKELAKTAGELVRVVAQKKGKLAVEAGLLALVDARHRDRVTREEPSVDQSRAGAIAWVATAADGEFAVTLRVVSGGAPLPSDDEWSRIDGSSKQAVIDIPSGKLAATTPGSEKPITLDVEPGRYAVAGYVLGEKYLFIAAKTEAPLGGGADEIETLE